MFITSNREFKHSNTALMKKLFLLSCIVLITGSVLRSQVVVPDDWTIDPGIDTYQETADPHGGESACQIDVQSTSPPQCDLANSTVIPVTAGETYKFKYWYKSSANVKIKGHLIWSNGDQKWVTANQGESDWKSKANTGTVPAGATSVVIEFRFAAETGMEPGETQYLDDITFESPEGTQLTVNNGDMESWPEPVIDPEPSNYPTDFKAKPHLLVMSTKWTEDTLGPDFPSGYLVMGSKKGYSAPLPVDGTPVDDDLDWGDGVVAMNRDAGLNGFDFTALETNTEYTFAIYPYSNTGDIIDYKTDGTIPVDTAMTADALLIASEDFEGTSISWSTYDVSGVDEWDFPYFNGNTTAKADGYSGEEFHVNEDWLISPEVDLSGYQNAYFSFWNTRNLDGPLMELHASTDYDGSSDPNTATWNDLTDMASWSEGGYQPVNCEDLDLTSYTGGTVYLAFKYTSEEDEGVLYKLDNMQFYSYNPYLAVEAPNGGEEIMEGTSYTIEWDHNYWEGEINIGILKEGEDVQDIALGVDVADSTYFWNLSSDLEPGDDYRIVITAEDGQPADTSNAYFSIIPSNEVSADFMADTTLLVVGDSVTFTDLSLGTVDSWEWIFEGGTPATYSGQDPPAVVYSTAGVFDVTLIVNNEDNIDTMYKEDYITAGLAPVADFEASVTEILVGETVSFTNLSDGDDMNFEWTFEGGEPNTSTEENPADIAYNEAGVFDVTLVATNIFGTDTLTMEDYITADAVGFADQMEEFIQAYPNPAKEHLKIQLPEEGHFQIIISSANGQIHAVLSDQSGLINISLEEFRQGLYIVSVQDDEQNVHINRKIVVHQ